MNTLLVQESFNAAEHAEWFRSGYTGKRTAVEARRVATEAEERIAALADVIIEQCITVALARQMVTSCGRMAYLVWQAVELYITDIETQLFA